MNSIFTEYRGEVVSSNKKDPKPIQIELISLTQNLLKIQFEWEGEEFAFRCFHSQDDEDLLFQVQQTVKANYIIDGVGGFLYNNPKIHGGFIKKLNGLFFHIILNKFDSLSEEIYFFGKRNLHYKKEAKSIRSFI